MICRPPKYLQGPIRPVSPYVSALRARCFIIPYNLGSRSKPHCPKSTGPGIQLSSTKLQIKWSFGRTLHTKKSTEKYTRTWDFRRRRRRCCRHPRSRRPFRISDLGQQHLLSLHVEQWMCLALIYSPKKVQELPRLSCVPIVYRFLVWVYRLAYYAHGLILF